MEQIIQKITRKILYSFYLISLTSYISSCSDSDSILLFNKAVGEYVVDFNSSDTNFTGKERNYYNNATLKLNDDGTFIFSQYVPSNRSTSGNWEIVGSEIERRLRLNYCWGYEETDICETKNCVIYFKIPLYQDNIVNGYRNLAYRKK